jgi:hypothetical protein
VFVGLAVKAPVGDMVSQVLTLQLCSDTWAVALVLVGAVTVSVCDAGADAPATALNVNAEGLTVRPTDVVPVTVRVTLKVTDPWFELTKMVLV